MSERAFFDADAKTRTVAVVQAIEEQTSAEIVVALRKSSGYYRHADYLCGLGVAVAAVVAVVLVPEPMNPLMLPLDVLLSFALGAAFCARFATIRRLLTRPRRRRENVRTAARAAFHDLGVSRTTGRWGVLVFLSMLERDLEVVPDVGIDLEALGEEWTGTVEAMRQSMRAADFERLLEATRGLGPLLARLHPVRDDDVNELPDELSAP